MYVVFDFETTIIEKYKRKANPLLPENYPVCSGFLYAEKDWDEYTDYHIDRDGQALPDDMFRDADLMVGQNIRFDLMYIWRHPQTIKFFKNGGKVWDIQYAEYLLTAQESTWASLDQMSKKYGLELKPDNIKKYWQAGVCTRDIPQSELLPYQEHDCRNTKEIFIRQWKQAKKLGLLNSIWAHMDGLMALLEMEYNGLAIDKEAKENDQRELEGRLEEIQEKLDTFIKKQFPDLPFEFNWGSNVHVSALFFGGSVKYTERELIGYCKGYRSIPMVDEFGDPVRIKSGPNKGKFRTVREEYEDLDRPKYKNNEYYYKFKRQTNPQSNWATKVPGVYSVDKYTILVLKNRGSKVAELLAEYNKLNKDLSTYYKSIDDVLYPDSIIHHMLNPTVAITGRLSSSNPNLQNLPKGDKSKCRRMFVSRFGAEGKMIEVDEKQLEVVIQAWFSGDENMMKDVNDGVDFHCVEEHTEILTNTGWQQANKVNRNTQVATKNLKTGFIEYEPPQDVWVAYNCPLVSIKGDMHDELVSKQHTVILDNKRTKLDKLINSKVKQTNFSYCVTSDRKDYNISDNKLRLIVQTITDGKIQLRTHNGAFNGIHWKLSKTRKIKRLRELLDNMDIIYSTPKCPKTGINKLQPTYTSIYGDEAYEIYSYIGPEKNYPEFFKSLSERQVHIVLEELGVTDGHCKGRQMVLTSSSIKQLEDLQEMCVTSGVPCKLNRYSVINYFTKQPMIRNELTIVIQELYDRRYVEIKDTYEKGTVIGITTSNGTIITRRNGKVVVTGNCKRLAYKLSMEYEDVLYKCTEIHDQYFTGMRTKIKTFSFQRAYGAGATAIAAETGLKIAEVKMLENDEKAMYPLIEPFSDDVMAACEASREWTPYKTEQGEEVHRGYYQSLTGKYYSFKTIDLPEYKQKQWVEGEPRTQFYMPQIKNYPIQGGGGEIVIGLLGRLWRKKFLAKDNYGHMAFMVNTVHDCVWADSHDDKVAEVVWDIEEVMTDVQGLFDDYYDGQIVPVKFRVETEVGLNLYEMEHYEH